MNNIQFGCFLKFEYVLSAYRIFGQHVIVLSGLVTLVCDFIKSLFAFLRRLCIKLIAKFTVGI